MKKGTIINKIFILTLAIIATFSLNTASAFAESDVVMDAAEKNIVVVPDEIHVGNIINWDSGKAIVIETNEDGSFKTLKVSENLYASCNHNKWIQYTNPKFKYNRRVSSDTICYYKVYGALYKCASCSTTREIETNMPVNHKFQNNKCTSCGRKKK